MRELRGSSRLILALAAVLALVLAACGGAEDVAGEAGDDAPSAADDAPSAAGDPVSVTFAPTAPLPSYWPFYWLADGLGFYADENLEVEIVSTGSAVQAALLTDRLDFAGAGLDFIPQGAEEERLQYYMATDRYVWLLMTFADSDITSVEDLRGRTIGINEPHDTLDAELIMASGGVPRGEYELVPVGEDRAALIAMENGDVDAFVAAYQAQEFLPGLTDRELVQIDTPDLDGWYNTGIMATVDDIGDQRDLAVRFGRAVARAMVWQYENPQVAAEVMTEVAPDWAPSTEEGLVLLEMVNDWNRDIYEDRGRMEDAVYQQMIDTHAELGFIEESYPADRIFTNDLIDDIWGFDIEAEQEAARSGER